MDDRLDENRKLRMQLNYHKTNSDANETELRAKVGGLDMHRAGVGYSILFVAFKCV